MEKTLRELAEYLHGTLENEDQKLIVTGVNGLVDLNQMYMVKENIYLKY